MATLESRIAALEQRHTTHQVCLLIDAFSSSLTLEQQSEIEEAERAGQPVIVVRLWVGKIAERFGL